MSAAQAPDAVLGPVVLRGLTTEQYMIVKRLVEDWGRVGDAKDLSDLAPKLFEILPKLGRPHLQGRKAVVARHLSTGKTYREVARYQDVSPARIAQLGRSAAQALARDIGVNLHEILPYGDWIKWMVHGINTGEWFEGPLFERERRRRALRALSRSREG